MGTFAVGSLTQPAAAQKPLFRSDSVLQVRLEAPFRRMVSERERRAHSALLIAGDGEPIPVEISARGKSRLASRICSFPGFMLHFDSTTVERTPFAGQADLPLTAHCKDLNSYEQYLLLEYLVYGTYALLSDLSLRARLARVEYVDSEHGDTLTTRFAFFLEHWDDLAARSGWMRVRAPTVPPFEYGDADRNVFEMFQYLVGNTDWSYANAPPDEPYCCHNSVPIGNPAGPVFPVPFDFDQAGMVDASYAQPSSKLPIRRVRQRHYRGMCTSPETLAATFDLFRARRQAIETLYEQAEWLTERSRRDAMEYLEDFYSTIANPGRVERDFVRGCRTMP